MTIPTDTELLPPSGDATKLPALGAPEPTVQWLAKVKEILESLLGRRGGSDWDRVVTFRDLYGAGGYERGRLIVGGGTFDPQSDTLGLPPTALAALTARIESELRHSAAFQALSTKIGSLEDLAIFPDEIRSQLSQSLDQLARQRGADIQQIDRKIQSGTMSMASRLVEVTAAFGRLSAGVRKLDAAYADSTRAIATSVTQVAARLDDVDGGGVTIEEKFLAQSSVLDGLLGQWSIKIEAGSEDDPIIAGIALSVEDPVSGPATSSLIFKADKLGFFTSTGNVMPFGADAGGLYVNGALRVGAGGSTLGTLTDGMINFVGDFAAAPATAGYRVNDVYKNTTDGNSYRLTLSGSAKIWTLFIAKGANGSNGANGADGYDGSNGQRGTVSIAAGGYTSWSDAGANAAISGAGYGAPVNRDMVTLYGSGFSETRFYDGGSWLTIAAYINGNAIVTGTLSANKISAGTLTGIQVSLGPGGEFMVDANGKISAVDALFSVAGFGNLWNPSESAISSGAYGTVPCAKFESTFGNAVQGSSTNGYGFYAASGGYGPFTGAHDALIANGADIDVGDLVVDVECVAARGYSNTLFIVEKASEPYQRGVRGPVSIVRGAMADYPPAACIDATWDTQSEKGLLQRMPIMCSAYYDLQDSHTLVSMNAVGEGQIKVCGEGGPIGPDDLLVTSSLPGVAMRQNDDIVRGYTVAKARVGRGQSVTFAAPDEIKILPCIYLCG